jgi:hypothetical protein
LLPLASKEAIGSTNRNVYTSPEFEAAAEKAVHGDPADGEAATASMETLVVEDVAFLSVAYAANFAVSGTSVQLPELSEILIWQPWAQSVRLGK